MASKTLVLLGLFALLLIVFDMAAASRTQPGAVKPKEEILKPNQQGYGGNGPIGYGGGGNNGRACYCCPIGRGGCSRCCSYA